MMAHVLRVVIVLAACAAPRESKAAFERTPLDAASAAMGGISATSPDPVFGSPGRLATPGAPEWSVAVDASRPFGWTELTEAQTSFARLGPAFGWACGARRFGTAHYAESEARVAAAWGRAPASIGLAARGLEVSGTGFAALRSIALDAGLLVRAAGDLELGAVLEGIAGDVPGDVAGEHRRAALGISGPIGSAMRVFLEGQRRGPDPLAGVVGVSLRPTSSLMLRAGARMDPEEIAWGASFARPSWTVEIAVQHHDPLGDTIRVGLRVRSESRRPGDGARPKPALNSRGSGSDPRGEREATRVVGRRR
jgi:hypothetical protein